MRDLNKVGYGELLKLGDTNERLLASNDKYSELPVRATDLCHAELGSWRK